jgi:hypothetical protein
MPDPDSSVDLVTRALAAYDELVSLAEEVDDEWSYVQDLSQAWRTQLEAVGDPSAAPELSAQPAIDRLVDEIGRITDPHRAIDWLSTFPQAVLLALGADPWATAALTAA